MHTLRQRIYYIIADFVSANLAWFVFNIIRYFTLPYNHLSISFGSYYTYPIVILGQCLFPLMMIGLYAVSGYYNKVFFKSRLNDLLNAIGISLIGACIIFFTALFNDKIDDRLGNIEMLLILWFLLSIFAILPRLIITSYVTRLIWKRKIVFDVMLVGDSTEAKKLIHDLETRYRNMGLRVVDVVSDTDPLIDKRVVEAKVDSFIIMPNEKSAIHIIDLINVLLPTGKRVYITPDLYHLIALRPRTSMVAGQVLIDVSHADIAASTANLKRIGDIICSSVAIVALAPVIAILALLVKFDSKGKAFYTQERIGYNKKPFKIYKLRTMVSDAEANGPSLSSETDPRITRVGSILRKYRLDELPQFWNVLKGDMSLVGPRPEREYYLKQIMARAPYFSLIHQVRPGITSWGMVKYGYATNVDQMIERLKYDLLYIDNVSMAVDLKILFYTVRIVCTGKGI